VFVLHVGLDLSRKRVEVCLISGQGELIDRFTATPDRDGLYGLARRVAVYEEPVRGVVESMNGARFVHDELTGHGWEVLVADAQKVKGLAPLACKTDKIDARVLAELSFRDLVPAIWLPTLELRREREISRWRLHLVKHRSTLKNRVHSTLITFGHQRHMSDLFGPSGRKLLRELEIPEPWRSHVDASLVLIDDLEARITQIVKELRRSGADHRYIPILMTAPGFGWITFVHGRVRDRRHQPLRLAGQAHRLHGLVPAGQAIRADGPARAAVQARAQVFALGADGGRDRRLLAPALPRALPEHPPAARSPARPQGGADRPRAPAHRGDLVHAYS
jgi:Transposase